MASHANFEIDIIAALSEQLLESFEGLEPGPLTVAEIGGLRAGQGIYQLFHRGVLVYVGKADNLPARLEDHRFKITGRHNITVADMAYKCLYIHPNWTSLAPEASLIKHYKHDNAGLCEWNGYGFGPHDPGRERETTNKPPEGFDARYPIRAEWVCDWIKGGDHNGRELLMALKAGLPFLLRYQVTNTKRWQRGHPDYNGATVAVPRDDMTARDLLALVASHLDGWQATVFVSHMILYKELRPYPHGEIVHPTGP